MIAQLEVISSRLNDLEKRASERDKDAHGQVVQILEEFRGMKDNVASYLANFDEKLNIINGELLSVKAEQSKILKRIRKLETDNLPQVVTQEHGF